MLTLKWRAWWGLSSWCARCTGLKVIKRKRGCMLEEHRSNIVDGIGRLGQRLILQLHDHR